MLLIPGGTGGGLLAAGESQPDDDLGVHSEDALRGDDVISRGMRSDPAVNVSLDLESANTSFSLSRGIVRRLFRAAVTTVGSVGVRVRRGMTPGELSRYLELG